MADSVFDEKVVRRDVDNPYVRNIKKDSYKNRQFGEKRRTTDEYTGGEVFFSAHGKGKGREERRHFTPGTTANVDHVTPIDVLIERYGDLIPPDDLRRIANCDFNLVLTNEALNKRKGGQTNIEYLLKQIENQTPENAVTTLRMIVAQIKSEAAVTGSVTICMVKEGGKIVAAGAIDAVTASAIPLAICATQNLVKVAQGEMTVKEAAKEVAGFGVSVAVAGGTKELATQALGELLEKMAQSDSKNLHRLKEMAGSVNIGTVLMVATIVAHAAGRYLSGKINGEECFREIAKNGASLVAGMLASKTVTLLGIAPGTVPAVLAAMLASAVCTVILEGAQTLANEAKTNREIRHIAEDARQSIRAKQDELKQLIDEDHQKWLSSMNDIFQAIASGIMCNDLQSTNQGLAELMSMYNRQVQLYQSGNEALEDLLRLRRGELKKLI